MKRLLPVLILAVAAAAFTLLLVFQPEPDETAPPRPRTTVEILEARPGPVRLSVRSQGTVMPRTETALSAEVSGKVTSVAEVFRSGAEFEKGDVLLRLEKEDYASAVAAREAELADARLALRQEEALAKQAKADWEALGQGEADPLTLREPQLESAKARVKSAKAALAEARRDLRRTRLRAPYDGRVLSRSADVGQYVAPGEPLGRIHAIDTAEIRLPLTEHEAALLNPGATPAPAVSLRRPGAPEDAVRTGRLDRMEAAMDPATRLLHAVALVSDPFAPGASGGPALRRGLFVEAEIEGRRLENAYRLPRRALRASSDVYVVTDENTLVSRAVSIVKSDPQSVVIEDGLRPGDRIAVSPVAYFVEGMPVEVARTP